jgi:polysaccharide biosynthesis/export protein
MNVEIRRVSWIVCQAVDRLTRLLARAALAMALGGATLATAQQASAPADYPLGPGDVVRITVFQIPDLTTETRVSEQGYISFPLIGNLPVKGVPALALERAIEQKLRDGGFVKKPQVTVVITQFKSIQVSVLGQVNKPGKYSLEQTKSRLSEVLAMAGGMTPLGGDVVTVVTQESGTEKRIQVDVHELLQMGDSTRDIALKNGDVVYVSHYPVYYIYGEVNRPGQYRVERDMTVQQALAVGGGPTPRGTQRGMELTRKDAAGKPVTRVADPAELVQSGDVLFIKESVF